MLKIGLTTKNDGKQTAQQAGWCSDTQETEEGVHNVDVRHVELLFGTSSMHIASGCLQALHLSMHLSRLLHWLSCLPDLLIQLRIIASSRLYRCQAHGAPLPEDREDDDVEVSEDDVQFVDEYSQRLGFLTSLNREQIDRYCAPAQLLPTCQRRGQARHVTALLAAGMCKVSERRRRRAKALRRPQPRRQGQRQRQPRLRITNSCPVSS